MHCDHRNATTTLNDNVAVSVCLDGRTTGKLLVVQMAQLTEPCPRAGVKTTVEQAEKRQARGDVLLEPREDGTLYQELRDTVRVLLSRLQQFTGDHAQCAEMSGLQEVEKRCKRPSCPEMF